MDINVYHLVGIMVCLLSFVISFYINRPSLDQDITIGELGRLERTLFFSLFILPYMCILIPLMFDTGPKLLEILSYAFLSAMSLVAVSAGIWLGDRLRI